MQVSKAASAAPGNRRGGPRKFEQLGNALDHKDGTGLRSIQTTWLVRSLGVPAWRANVGGRHEG